MTLCYFVANRVEQSNLFRLEFFSTLGIPFFNENIFICVAAKLECSTSEFELTLKVIFVSNGLA